MKFSLASSPAQSRQTRQQFANPDAYLSYELGKAVQELPPLYTQLVAVSLSLAVFGAIAWASFSKVDEVAVAPGQLIPSEQVQPVRALDAGNIQAIKVKQGQHVRRGDTLVELESQQFQADVDKLKDQAESIRADLKRATEAAAEGHKARINEAEIELSRLRDNLNYAKRDVNRLRILNVNSAIPRQDYEHAQDKVRDLEKNIAVQEKSIQQLNQDYRSENLTQLSQRRDDLSNVERQLNQAKDRLKKQTISAPVAGTVYDLKATSGEGTVQTGQELLSILPEGKESLLEVEVSNQYRGFIDEGMKVKVKIDSFPYQEFGTIDGTVVYVSPNAVSNNKNSGTNVFLARIKLKKLSIRVRGKDKNLTAGMSATGEIIMRQKSILSFLIEPITQRFDEVFSVR